MTRSLFLAAMTIAALPLFAQHVDFARHFPSEERQRAEVQTALTRLESYRGRVARSAPTLEAAIRAYEEALKKFERLAAWLYLHAAIDTANAKAAEAEQILSAELERRTAFFVREVGSIPEATLQGFVRKRPALKRYAWFLQSARERAAHQLPLPQEEIVAALQPFTSTWQAELKDALDTHQSTPAASAEAPARETFVRRYEELTRERDLYAFTLVRLARARNAIAKLHGYEDAGSEVYAASNFTKGEITRLLDELAAHADMYKRYQTMRADRVGGNLWDLRDAARKQSAPAFTIDEARTILARSTAAAGSAYGAELARLLDPAAGRIDVEPGPRRRRGGFSKGFPGFPSVFYMQGFTGSYNDLRIVAHESTHAVQRQLEADAGVSPLFIDGPKFLAEAYATFHELLLPDLLARETSDPARKRYFLEQFLDSKGIAVIFSTASEAAIEQAIYDGVATGSITSADDLDALTRRVASRYSIWPVRHDELRMQWMEIRLLYDDPFYDVNYTLAGLVALELFARYTADLEGFSRAYAKLIANGYTEAPEVLLRRFMGIDIRDPHFVAHALASAQRHIDALAEIYRTER
jgi:oligoendopeptidase F